MKNSNSAKRVRQNSVRAFFSSILNQIDLARLNNNHIEATSKDYARVSILKLKPKAVDNGTVA